MPVFNAEDKIYDRCQEFVKNNMPDFAVKYFEHLDFVGKSPRTILQYAYDIKGFLDYLKTQPGFRDMNFNACKSSDILDLLTYDDLDEYAKFIGSYEHQGKKKKSSDAYKARKIASLRSFYHYYYKVGEIAKDTASLLEVPKNSGHEKEALNKNETIRLIKAISEYPADTEKKRQFLIRDKAMFILMLGTGIRVSELVSINANNIDKEQKSIRIIRKGGKEDVVFYNDIVESALEDWDQERALLCPSADPYFISNKGTRLDSRSVERLLTKYGTAAGLSINLTPHILRKTYGTSLYKNTSDIYLVAKALGHSSVETTAKHYIKDDLDDKKFASNMSILNDVKT